MTSSDGFNSKGPWIVHLDHSITHEEFERSLKSHFFSSSSFSSDNHIVLGEGEGGSSSSSSSSSSSNNNFTSTHANPRQPVKISQRFSRVLHGVVLEGVTRAELLHRDFPLAAAGKIKRVVADSKRRILRHSVGLKTDTFSLPWGLDRWVGGCVSAWVGAHIINYTYVYVC